MKRSWILVCILFSVGRLCAQQELTLEQAIALALSKNYDVKLAENVAKNTAVDDKYSFGAFLPALNGSASTVRNVNNQRIEFGGVRDTLNDEGTNEFYNISASLQLSWTLFDGGKMFISRNRFESLDEQAQLNLKNQMVNTIATVILNYHDIVRQKQQLKAINEQMAVSDERVKLATRKVDVGIGARPELLQAKVDYNAFRTQALQQQANIEQLKQQLNVLTGLQIQNTYEVADTIIIDLDMREADISEGIENKNYQLLSAKKSLEIANFLVRERRAEMLPILMLNGAYSHSEVNNIQLINRLSAVYNQSDGFNYGLSLNVPIFNGFTRKRLVQQSKINFDRQYILFEQSKATVNTGVRNAFIGYDNAKKILLIEEETIVLARENVFIALESFKRGVATFIELRTAQQSLAEAYNRLIAARYNAKVAETELLRLNGSLLK